MENTLTHNPSIAAFIWKWTKRTVFSLAWAIAAAVYMFVQYLAVIILSIILILLSYFATPVVAVGTFFYCMSTGKSPLEIFK